MPSPNRRKGCRPHSSLECLSSASEFKARRFTRPGAGRRPAAMPYRIQVRRLRLDKTAKEAHGKGCFGGREDSRRHPHFHSQSPFLKQNNPEFIERRNTARDAKAALLEKMKARREDPALAERQAERAAIVAARNEREAVKRAEAAEAARLEAERQAQLEAERQAAREAEAAAEAERNSEANRHVNRFLADEAALKAARDARYAARRARKGG